MPILEEYQCSISGEREIPSLILKIKALMETHASAASLRYQTDITTAALELARNIIAYAGRGQILLKIHSLGKQKIFELEALDQGPGIKDIELAMQDGYSTKGTLGLGLPGVRRLMDDFSIESSPGQGTRVVAKKWI